MQQSLFPTIPYYCMAVVTRPFYVRIWNMTACNDDYRDDDDKDDGYNDDDNNTNESNMVVSIINNIITQ